MMTKPAYKFISYPYECDLGSSPNTLIEYTIQDKDIDRDQMLEQFQYFLKAAGYQFNAGDYITVNNDEDDVYEEYAGHQILRDLDISL